MSKKQTQQTKDEQVEQAAFEHEIVVEEVAHVSYERAALEARRASGGMSYEEYAAALKAL